MAGKLINKKEEVTAAIIQQARELDIETIMSFLDYREKNGKRGYMGELPRLYGWNPTIEEINAVATSRATHEQNWVRAVGQRLGITVHYIDWFYKEKHDTV